jgi:uncharacterized membrane protein (DUF4010 family)
MTALMQIPPIFSQLGLALGLGLLVGLQRERTGSSLAGFRTFPMVTVLGALCSILAQIFDSGWLIGLGLLVIGAMMGVANIVAAREPEADPGTTTEAALLVMFATGAYIPVGIPAVAIVIGGGVAVLLHMKPQLHSFAGKMGEEDFKAIMQFVLITLVVLPVLPNKTFGPFNVLNPFKIWLMVVLIVGISLGGYVIHKIFGDKVGTLAAGVLGGFISSTATTVSASRQCKENPQGMSLAAIMIMTASTIVFVRLLILIGSTAPTFLKEAARPFCALLGVLAVISIACWWLHRGEKAHLGKQSNPSELKGAMFFAFLYAVILIAVAASKKYLGDSGLWVVAIVSGLTDMDAITLSIAQMVEDGHVVGNTGWRLIMAAALANVVFKGSIVASIGVPALFRRIVILFGIAFIAGLAILIFWPANPSQPQIGAPVWG